MAILEHSEQELGKEQIESVISLLVEGLAERLFGRGKYSDFLVRRELGKVLYKKYYAELYGTIKDL